jgi:hypothetical protein
MSTAGEVDDAPIDLCASMLPFPGRRAFDSLQYHCDATLCFCNRGGDGTIANAAQRLKRAGMHSLP